MLVNVFSHDGYHIHRYLSLESVRVFHDRASRGISDPAVLPHAPDTSRHVSRSCFHGEQQHGAESPKPSGTPGRAAPGQPWHHRCERGTAPPHRSTAQHPIRHGPELPLHSRCQNRSHPTPAGQHTPIDPYMGAFPVRPLELHFWKAEELVYWARFKASVCQPRCFPARALQEALAPRASQLRAALAANQRTKS